METKYEIMAIHDMHGIGKVVAYNSQGGQISNRNGYASKEEAIKIIQSMNGFYVRGSNFPNGFRTGEHLKPHSAGLEFTIFEIYTKII